MTWKRDPTYIKRTLKICQPALRFVFRYRITGFEKLGADQFILVSNHNVGAPYEIMALLDAWVNHFGSEKPILGMAHRFPFKIPFIRTAFERIGAIPATYEDAFRTLDMGVSLAVFPGGNYESVRPFSERNQCDLGGRKGWARIALSRNVSVVPVSIIGSHAINPVLIRSQLLANLLVVPKSLGLRWFPVSVSQILYPALTWILFAKLGVSVLLISIVSFFIFLVSAQWPSWPAQIKILIGDPIKLEEVIPVNDEVDQRLDSSYKMVAEKIQAGMDLLNSRS